MSTGENIRRFRDERGLTQPEFGKIAGVKPSAVSNWETDRNLPLMGALERLAAYFGVPKSAITDGPTHHPRTLRAVPSDTNAPLYGRIAAGAPIEAIPVERMAWAPPQLLADYPRGFYLIVQGESMNRELPNGSYAFIDPDAEVGEGDIVALNINGYDATIKRIYRRGSTTELHPSSWDESYKVEVFDSTRPDTETITLIGRVVWQRMPLPNGKL